MLLFDENLSPRLPKRLAREFPRSLHVNGAGLGGADDEIVWQYAATVGFAVVTNDDDYLVLSQLHGQPPKVIFLCLGGSGGEIVFNRLLASAGEIRDFLSDPNRSVCTVT